MGPSYYSYWGKALGSETADLLCHLLPYHCLDVAAVGKVLLEKDTTISRSLVHLLGPSAQQLYSWLLFFLALHDLGKFAEGFQNLRPDLLELLRGRRSIKGYAVRHDSLGYALWQDHLWDRAWQKGWLGLTGEDRDKRRWGRVFEAIARSTTGHHGVPPTRKGANNLTISAAAHFSASEMLAAEEFSSEVASILVDSSQISPGLSPEQLRSPAITFSWMAAGLTVLCDWLASGHFRLLSRPVPLNAYWLSHALPQAEETVARTGIIPARPAVHSSSSVLFPNIKAFSALQQHAADFRVGRGPQLFILEDLTGSGKTEAAIILAHRLMKEGHGTGLFIALPTMATSNAMYERIAATYRRLFEEGTFPSLVLSHSARHLSKSFRQSVMQPKRQEAQDYGPNEEPAAAFCATWLADNRKKALLADVGVGTVDQALMAALPVRYQSLRLFGLARQVLIVDEVHAYDPYMHVLLRTLLQFHAALGGSAILLSATLPRRTRQDLAESYSQGLQSSPVHLASDHYPLITQITKSGSVELAVSTGNNRRISQDVQLIEDMKEVEERISRASENGQCVCWIRNTVHDAVVAYEMLRERIPSHLLILFHARFAMGDRLVKETEVLASFGKASTSQIRRGKVLVATQVVEQSLDLDFDLLISDLAPIELLIQRAGRLRRHLRDLQGNPLMDRNAVDLREPAPFLIHSPVPDEDAAENWYAKVFPKASFVYPSHGRLWLTARLMLERGGWTMPDDARLLVEAVYAQDEEDRIPLPLLARDDEEHAKRSAERSLADLNKLKLEDGYAATPNQWLDDTRTPTRLGELQTTVRLARWNGSELTPWFAEGDFPWEMSQVNVRATMVAVEDVPNHERLRQALLVLKDHLPDRGKWSVLVPLTEDETGAWKGTARGPKGEKVTVHYDEKTGLQLIREGG